MRLAFDEAGLWFDKFMGDGILAFGPVWGDARYGAVPLRQFLQVLGQVSAIFDAAPLRDLREMLGLASRSKRVSRLASTLAL